MNWDEHRTNWPNAAHSRFVTTRACRWHMQDAGSGPVVLLLHGAGASTHSFRALFADLSQTFRVIALDLPGQGFTRSLAGVRLGLDGMAEDILALLQAEALMPAAIVGHSAGAAIALRMAQQMPQAPRAIVALNGAMEGFRGLAGVVFPVMAKILALNPLTAMIFSRSAGSQARVRGLIASTGSMIDAEGLALYRVLIADRGHVNATLGMMANWNLQTLLADLPGIDVPVLFLTGANDKAVPPASSAEAAARMPQAQVENIPGYGHLLHEEDPAGTAARIRRFVSDHLNA